jgi:orotidine-5'-phosphate decarboxylase
MNRKISTFRELMESSSSSKKSRVVLALDLSATLPKDSVDKARKELLEKALSTLDATHDHIAALKINHQLLLPLGLYDMMQVIMKRAKKYGLPLIMDCKANDVEHTNRWIARHYFDGGFDAIIANPFVGWEGGIEPIMSESKGHSKGVILLTYMSHKGAIEGYGQQVLPAGSTIPKPQYLIFAEKAAKWDADGVVVGATYPGKIEEVYKATAGRVPIYSPGIGAQGGEIEAVFDAGCRYAIVGRLIYESDNPETAATKIKDEINRVLERHS